MMCTWSEKSHKLCGGGCEDGCIRKKSDNRPKSFPGFKIKNVDDYKISDRYTIVRDEDES